MSRAAVQETASRLFWPALTLVSTAFALQVIGLSPWTVWFAGLIVLATAAAQVEARHEEGSLFQRYWQALLLLATGSVYVFLAEPNAGSIVAFLVAIAFGWAAFKIEDARPADGWFKLAGVILATLTLLGGKGWRASVSLWPPTNLPAGIPWQFLTFTLITILIYALFAMGLNLEFGFAGLINFGHVAFMAIGAYIVSLLTIQAGLWSTQLGIAASLGLAVLGGALAGMLLALPAIRLREDYLAIVTIAAAEILRRFLNNEQQWTHGPQGVTITDKPLSLDWLASIPGGAAITDGLDTLAVFFGFSGSPYLFVLLGLVLTATILVIALIERLVQSPWGRTLEAIREDEDAARALGVNPTIYKLQVFAIGSAVAALAGAFLAWQVSFIVPNNFRPPVTFWAWIMIVIGGLGNNKGAVAGAFIFWTINELTTNVGQLRSLGLDTEQISAFATLALGALLIGFMLSRPEGLFGDKEELELVE